MERNIREKIWNRTQEQGGGWLNVYKRLYIRNKRISGGGRLLVREGGRPARVPGPVGSARASCSDIA